MGLAAAAIAKNHGAEVVGTTRNPKSEQLLRASGVDRVIIDDGVVAPKVREMYPQGVTKVLELVGTTTLEDSLQCIKPYGVVCMTGIVGNKWTMENFAPMAAIPPQGYLTRYSGGPEEFLNTPLNELAEQIVAGTLHIQVGKVFQLDQIVEAHRTMDANRAGGKIVVLT